jgi:peptidoglycan/xylan/chitin deacetylase (PgdA/CDA1 family)
MMKPMIKIYTVLAFSLVLCVLFIPAVLGHTSAWALDTSVYIRLLGQPDMLSSADTANTARIIFVMDDGWDTQYTQGYAILKKYDYPGCVAVIPAAVDTESYMTYSQLADLYIDGWDMLNHTYNHETLSGNVPQEQSGQMNGGREWLKSHGLMRGSDIIVFPGGSFDDATLETLVSEGFVAGRSLKSLWTTKAGCSLENVEICNLVNGMSFEYVQRTIDKAIRNDSALILVIHKIEAVTDDMHMQIPPEFYTRIVDYVHEQGNELEVVTMTQLLASM